MKVMSISGEGVFRKIFQTWASLLLLAKQYVFSSCLLSECVSKGCFVFL